jgi:hypothetical protein
VLLNKKTVEMSTADISATEVRDKDGPSAGTAGHKKTSDHSASMVGHRISVDTTDPKAKSPDHKKTSLSCDNSHAKKKSRHHKHSSLEATSTGKKTKTKSVSQKEVSVVLSTEAKASNKTVSVPESLTKNASSAVSDEPVTFDLRPEDIIIIRRYSMEGAAVNAPSAVAGAEVECSMPAADRHVVRLVRQPLMMKSTSESGTAVQNVSMKSQQQQQQQQRSVKKRKWSGVVVSASSVTAPSGGSNLNNRTMTASHCPATDKQQTEKPTSAAGNTSSENCKIADDEPQKNDTADADTDDLSSFTSDDDSSSSSRRDELGEEEELTRDERFDKRQITRDPEDVRLSLLQRRKQLHPTHSNERQHSEGISMCSSSTAADSKAVATTSSQQRPSTSTDRQHIAPSVATAKSHQPQPSRGTSPPRPRLSSSRRLPSWPVHKRPSSSFVHGQRQFHRVASQGSASLRRASPPRLTQRTNSAVPVYRGNHLTVLRRSLPAATSHSRRSHFTSPRGNSDIQWKVTAALFARPTS